MRVGIHLSNLSEFLGPLHLLVTITAYAGGIVAFLTLVKWTGFGTLLAAVCNALLNASFTYVVGKYYQESWRDGINPAPGGLRARILEVIDEIDDLLDSEATRKALVADYKKLRAAGYSIEDAIWKMVTKLFS